MAETKTSQVLTIPLSDLVIPPWNPRRFMDENELQNLTSYLDKGGLVPRILVWSESSLAPWSVISGQRRVEAYRRLGRTQIEAEVLPISLEEAKFLAIASNKDDKPYWLGEFTAVENLKKENKDLKGKELATRLGWTEKRVSHALSLMEILNPASRKLIEDSIRQKITSRNFSGSENLEKGSDWLLTEEVARRLAPIANVEPLEKAQPLAQQVLEAVMTHQFTGSQADQLVAWALEGKAVADFQPGQKVRKARTPKTANEPSTHSKSPSHPTDFSRESALPKRGTQLEASSQVAHLSKGEAEGQGDLAVPTSSPAETVPIVSTPAPSTESVWYWFKRIWAEIWLGLKSKFQKQLVQVGIVMLWFIGIGLSTWVVGFIAHARWTSLWDIVPKQDPIAVTTSAATPYATVEPAKVEASAPTSVPRPQAEEQALSAPISKKQEIGAAVPIQTIDASEVTSKPEEVKENPIQKKPAKVQTKAKESSPADSTKESAQSREGSPLAASTQTPSPKKGEDIVGQVVDKAAPVAADAVIKSLF